MPLNPAVTRSIPKETFMNKVQKIKEMIEAGEAIQVVLSDYLEIDNLDPFQFYRNLRKINPSPYMYFHQGRKFLCRRVKPGGTHTGPRQNGLSAAYRRHKTKRGKSENVEEIIKTLTEDEKEKAEHLMLVDLARNDLSRICAAGSVSVESFMEPEVYSHVVHLVSQVKGELKENADVIDAITADISCGHGVGSAENAGHRDHRRTGRDPERHLFRVHGLHWLQWKCRHGNHDQDRCIQRVQGAAAGRRRHCL